jgi:low temperature requirement protein LtrA
MPIGIAFRNAKTSFGVNPECRKRLIQPFYILLYEHYYLLGKMFLQVMTAKLSTITSVIWVVSFSIFTNPCKKLYFPDLG